MEKTLNTTSSVSVQEDQAEPKSVTIKLSDVATSYINAQQRLFDLSSVILGSTRLINESQYDEFSKSMGVMPSSRTRLSFDDAKEETERWLFRHILSEGLGACLLAMSDCRTICALSLWKAKGEKDQEELKAILGSEKQDFDLMPVKEKFAYLKEKFNMTLEMEDMIDRLFKLRQVLLSQGGKVSEAEITEPGKLTLKLKMVQLQTSPLDSKDANSMKVSTSLSDFEKSFAVGDKVRVSKNEHVGSIITMSFFITSLMEGVQKFGKLNGMDS